MWSSCIAILYHAVDHNPGVSDILDALESQLEVSLREYSYPEYGMLPRSKNILSSALAGTKLAL